MKKTSSQSPARKQPLFRQLEAATGRENIADFLVASGDLRASRLLDMMLDPAYAGLSFGQLCSRAGLSGGEVLHLICQRQLAEGTMRMAYHLPDIMENVALAARDHDVICVKCGGHGNVSGTPCADCCGSGQVRVPADFRAVRLMLEMFGILPYRESQGNTDKGQVTRRYRRR
jgi:hypothetical protein